MIKKLTSQKELQNVLDLTAYAFNFTAIEDYQEGFLKLWQHSDNWGIVENEQLTSQILVFPFQVNLFGQSMKMAGIGNVATYPDYRGEGGIRRLFTAIFEELKENGTILSYLAPFSQPFYRKFGYEAIFSSLETTVTRQDITQLDKEKTGSIRRVDKNLKKWQLIVKKLYVETLEKHTGSVIREEWWWDNLFAYSPKKQLAICFDDTQKPVGYVFYDMNLREMIIHEVSYLNAFAVHKIGSFIASHNGTFDTFKFNTALSEQVKLLFSESRPVEQRVNEGMMVKIVSFELFIDSYRFNVKSDRSILLAVEDNFSSWNHGTWKLTVEAGKGRVRLISDQLLPEADFSGSIQAWTQVFLGRASLTTLLFLETISTTHPSKEKSLSELLPESDLALHDFF